MTSVLSEVQDIVAAQRELPPARVAPGALLVEALGADSDDLADIALSIDARFGVDLPGDVPIRTVADLAAAVERALVLRQHRAAAQARPA